VRGNDPYRLYGVRPQPKKYKFPLRNHTLSEAQEKEFLFHETLHPPLSGYSGTDPVSSDPAYDRAIRTRLEAPLWCRAYKVEGNISVSGKRGFVYLDSKLFQPSTAEQTPPYHTTYKRLAEEYRKRTQDRIKLDTVLLVRHTFGHIYYHTYHDLLTKIAWADELGLSKEIPIVISAKWARGHYGSHFVKSDLFEGRRVIWQELNQTLLCKSLYWLRTPQFWQPHLKRVANSFAEQKPDMDISDRLVLIREKKTHDDRICEGMEPFSEDLQRKGFTRLDPASLTIPEQKWVFARARHIVGENGSAFTNMVHRQDGHLQIDSLMHSKSMTSTFPAMAKAHGVSFRTHVLHSTRGQDVSHAVLDPKTKERILDVV